MALLEVKADFSELEERIQRAQRHRFSPIMQVVAEMLVSAVSDQYDSEGEGKWPPHAPATTRMYGHHRLLQLTGVLSGSTNAEWGEDFAEASTSVNYVKYHLKGGPKIPKRNPFEISDEAMGEASLYIVEEIAKLIDR